MNSNLFAGSSFSTFSHAVVSFRLDLSKNSNLCLFNPAGPISFLASSMTFGKSTPDPSCSQQIVEIPIQSRRERMYEILFRLDDFLKVFQLLPSEFNKIVWLLMEPKPLKALKYVCLQLIIALLTD
jgi:hypothetical protein